VIALRIIILCLIAAFPDISESAAEAYKGITGLNSPISRTIRDSSNNRHAAVYIVTAIREAKTLGEGIFSKKAGGKFVIVEFRLKNKSGRSMPADAAFDIKLIDGRKKIWKQSNEATGSARLGTESFGMMEIKAGAEIKDLVVFDVPGDVRDYHIVLPGGAVAASAPKPAKSNNKKTEDIAAVKKKEQPNAAVLESKPPETKKDEVKPDIAALIAESRNLIAAGNTADAHKSLEHAFVFNFDLKREEIIINLLKTSGALAHKRIEELSGMLDEAWSFYQKGSHRALKETADRVLSGADKLGYKRGLFIANYYLALYFNGLKDYDKAIEHAAAAQRIAEKGNDDVKASIAYKFMGKVLSQQKAYDRALDYYEKYLAAIKAIARKGEIRPPESALLKDSFSQYEDAVHEGFRAGGGRQFIAGGYINAGRMLKRLGNYEKANKSISDAIEIFREVGDVHGELFGIWEMADVYALHAEYGRAIRLLEDNLDIAQRFGLRQNFIDDIIRYAEKSSDRKTIEKYAKMKRE
jgi:tetratricopeptide (TPR) repeat protein